MGMGRGASALRRTSDAQFRGRSTRGCRFQRCPSILCCSFDGRDRSSELRVRRLRDASPSLTHARWSIPDLHRLTTNGGGRCLRGRGAGSSRGRLPNAGKVSRRLCPVKPGWHMRCPTVLWLPALEGETLFSSEAGPRSASAPAAIQAAPSGRRADRGSVVRKRRAGRARDSRAHGGATSTKSCGTKVVPAVRHVNY
jgi:hypothetical protein